MDAAAVNTRLQFVDLDNANEQEKNEIEGILFSREWTIKLPWGTRTDLADHQSQIQDDQPDRPASPPVVATEPPQHVAHVPPHGEWIQHYDDGQEMGGEGPMEAMPAPPMRGPVYPQSYMLVAPAMMPPYPIQFIPSHQQAYVQNYYPEQDEASAPRMMGPRGSKNRDKRMEHMQPQYVPCMPMMQYVPYSPMDSFPHHGFPVHPDQPPFHPDQPPFHHSPPQLEMDPQMPKEPPPIPEVEHLCYVTDVTVKAPKKKQMEEAPPVPEEVVQEAVVPLVVPEQIASPAPEPVVVPQEVVPEEAAPVVELMPVPASAPQVTTDYPGLDGGAQPSPAATAVVAQPPVQQDRKSWASLLQSPSLDTRPAEKPLARVPPARRSETPRGGGPAPDDVCPQPTLIFNTNVDYRITDDPYTVRLGSKLKDYSLEHRAMNITPRGLTNPGNYCYVNAILQALVACPPFFNLLKALPIPQDARQAARIPILGAMIELMQQFPQLPPKAKRRGREETPELPTGTSFEPRCVYKVLDKIRGEGLSVEGRQEDAEEFLSCLLNGLNDEMFEVLKLMGAERAAAAAEVVNGDAGAVGGSSADDAEAQEWMVMGPKNRGAVTRRAVCGNTPISEIFRGQQRSRLMREGGENTDSVQPFFSLQLDIEKAVSVKQALDLLMNKDVLEGMTCSKTNREIEAWTQTTLEDLPLILILHLKCFDYKHDGCSKIIKTVDYSVDLKIETKLVPGNKNKYTAKQRSYKLIAVVYHDGKEATKGHYVTDVYHVGLGVWIRYDDGNVRCVREEQVLKPSAPRVPYLLVYRRSDTASGPPVPTKP